MDGRNRDCNLAFVPAALQTRNHPLTAGGAPEPSGRGAIASKASLGPACSVNGTAEPSRSSYHPYARNSLGDGVSRVKDRPQSYVQQGPGYQLSCPSGNGADAWQSTLVYIGADEGQGISHFQPLPAACSRRCSSSSNAAGDSGLRPFPRPRPSVDNLGDSVNSLPAPPPPPSTPNESRILRRQQNQYKRHGSVTLAWQQRLSGSSLGSIKYGRGSFASNADPPGHVRDGANCASQRASRFSSGDCVGELLADTGASPISTPVNTWYRLSQASNSSNNNATPDDSGGMPVCRRGSVRSATIGTPTPARWTSSSFATPGVDHSWGSDSADSGCSNNGLAPSEPQAKRNSQAGGACGRSGARYGDSGGRQPCRRQSCTLFVPVNTSRASASAAQRLRLCEGSSHGEASQLQGGAAIGNGNNGACNANSAEEGDCGSSIGNNREGDKGLATSGSTASAACCHQSSARPSLYSGMNGIPTGDCSAANVAIPGVKDQLIAPRENDNAMGCCAENSCTGMRTTGSSSARSPAHSAYSSSSSIGGFRASSSSASSRGSSMLRSGAGSWETSMVLVMSEAGAVTQGCSSSSSSDRLLTHSNLGASVTTTANGAAAATLSEGCAIGRGSSTPHNRSGSHSAENPNPEWLTRPAQQSVAAGGNGRSSSSSNHYHNSTETTAQPGHKHSPLHEAADYSFVPQSLRVSQGQNGPPGADVQADGDGPVRGTERNRNLEAREEGGVGRLRSVASPTASDRAKAKSSASCTFSSSHAVAAKPAGPFFSSSATSPLPPPLCTSTPSSSSSASDSHVTPGRIATVSTSLSSHSRSNSAGSASATPVSQHTLSTSRGYPHSSSLDIETVVGADELSTYTAAHSRQAEGANPSISFGRSNSSALEKPCKESKDPTRRRHALLLTNPPKQALPLLPEEMTSLSVPSDATTAPALAPTLAADEASSAANTTAACTPTDALRCGSGAEKVGKHISMGGDNLFDNAAGVVNSPTHFVVQKKQQQQRRWPQEALAYVPQEAGEHDLDRNTFKYSSKTGVAGEHHRDSHLQGYDAHSQNDSSDAEDIARHPTLVFDSSPILRASALIEEALVDAESHRRTLHTTDSNQTAASSSGESSSAEDPDAGMRLPHRRIRSQSDVRPTNYGASAFFSMVAACALAQPGGSGALSVRQRMCDFVQGTHAAVG
ncbi:hypothetical protein GQ54DRAFT_337575 [Martensiomyces pterosporus]|nr:hypothetical protein GQ54DRAFT_337575 [Martensiomyces pterosporus]